MTENASKLDIDSEGYTEKGYEIDVEDMLGKPGKKTEPALRYRVQGTHFEKLMASLFVYRPSCP